MRILYNLAIIIIIILSPLLLLYRILKKKEHPKRFLEKFGFFQKGRAKGKLIWFHCSSVGEFLSIVPLIEKLEKYNEIKSILLSTSTLSSSKLFKKFKFKKTFHKFYPIDNPIIVNKFLNYWRPSAVFFIESEVWPEMIKSLKQKKINIFLLNARISKKSFDKWKYFKNFAKDIFNSYNYIYPQNKETLNYLKHFQVKRLRILGNLKFTETEQKNLSKPISKDFYNRKILCAASTHNNEEEIISNIHIILKKNISNLITIIIPRHIERSNEIIEMLKNNKLNYVRHSEKKKINKSTDIYLVDTYGENKTFYSLSKVVFLGGSLIPRGGQNPLEPIRFGCCIAHGKHTFNFTEIYNMLKKKNLSFEAKNILHLRKIIEKLLTKKTNNRKEINTFKKIGNSILERNLKEIKILI